MVITLLFILINFMKLNLYYRLQNRGLGTNFALFSTTYVSGYIYLQFGMCARNW